MTRDQETQLYKKRAFTLFTVGQSLYKDQIMSGGSKLHKPKFSDFVSLGSLLSMWNTGSVKSKESKKLLNNYFSTLGISPNLQPDIESVSYEAIEGHMVAELYLKTRVNEVKKQA